MTTADLLKLQGPTGVCVWGFDVSFSGIESCECTTDTVDGGIAFGIGSAKLTTLADLSAIPTLPIDGTCFNITNSAGVWLPSNGGLCEEGDAGCFYELIDPYIWFSGGGSGVGTNSALAVAQYYGNLNETCDGTPIGYCYGLDGYVRYYWSGTNQMLDVGLSVAPGNFEGNPVGPFPIFASLSNVASCLFRQNPSALTATNQLSCGTKFDSAYVIASGGSVTLKPTTSGGRVPLGCQGSQPAWQPCGGVSGFAGEITTQMQALSCWRQCIGTSSGSMEMRLSRTRRVAKALTGIAKALTGIDRAKGELIRTRTAICLACTNSVSVGGQLRKCNVCGCAIRLKVGVAGEKCPDTPSRWPAVG